MEIRVAIFEDNNLIREAIEDILEAAEGYECVGSFTNGRHWQQELERCKPDVVLMDIEMPGLDGIMLTEYISKEFSNINVLIQTVFNDQTKIFKALCAGATGYILKSDPPLKYLEAIKEVYHGGSYMNAEVARKTLGFFTNKNVIMVCPENIDFQLTGREKEVLVLLKENQSIKSIAENLFISAETVRTHVKHIYKKLHVANRTEAVLKAYHQGIG